MATLPQLIEEDIQRVHSFLGELLKLSDAATAMLIDKGGFLLANAGDSEDLDLTTIAALASGSYLANETIAGLVNEGSFDSVYQQGEKNSMLIMNVDENALLVVIFGARIAVGAVKYYAGRTIKSVATQLKTAWERDPAGGLDLSVLNLENPDVVFRKKS